MQFPAHVRDRQLEYFEKFDARIRKRLAGLVSPDLIEEHRRQPLGQHSDALDRILNYFRRGGLANKLGILRVSGGFRLVRFAGVRGAPSQVLDGPLIASLDEAYHAAFLARIDDLNASLSGENA